VVPNPLGARTHRHQVGARVGLGISLAPPDIGAADGRQMPFLLRRAAVGVEHRPDIVHTERREPGRAGTRGFVLEDVTLHRTPVAAAEMSRPVAHDPPPAVQYLLPAHVVVLAQFQTEQHLAPDFFRQFGANKGPHFLAKGGDGGVVQDVHASGGQRRAAVARKCGWGGPIAPAQCSRGSGQQSTAQSVDCCKPV